MNAYNLFRSLFKDKLDPQQQAGDVLFVDDGVVTVELPGGGRVQVRGNASPGDQVFFADGVIQSVTTAVPIIQISI